MKHSQVSGLHHQHQPLLNLCACPSHNTCSPPHPSFHPSILSHSAMSACQSEKKASSHPQRAAEHQWSSLFLLALEVAVSVMLWKTCKSVQVCVDVYWMVVCAVKTVFFLNLSLCVQLALAVCDCVLVYLHVCTRLNCWRNIFKAKATSD